MRLVLRDGAEVEGGIFLNDGQALAPYLGTRKGGWVNLVEARWLLPVEELVTHAVLQSDQVLYAYGVEGDVPVHSVQAALVSPRAIEVTLTNGTRVSGDLAIANKQRLSDFLHTSGKFIPIVAARRSDTGESVGDIALNHAAVRVLRDTGSGARSALETELAADGTPHAGTPIVRPASTTVRASLGTGRATPGSVEPPSARVSGAFDTAPISEGPSAIAEEIARAAAPAAEAAPSVSLPSVSLPSVSIPSVSVPSVPVASVPLPPVPLERREPARPSLRLNLDDDARPFVEEIAEPDTAARYSAAVEAVAARAAEHWLSRVAERFGLAPADPRRLGATFTDEMLWSGIARANDLSVDELAVHVATTFRLAVARLDRIDAPAIALLDEATARRHRVCPLRSGERLLVVATADPTDVEGLAALRALGAREIECEIAAPSAVQGAIDWWYRASA